MPNLRERAVAIFEYLAHLVQLRTKTIYDVAGYPSVYWLDELPKEDGCYTRARGDGTELDEDVWLEIRKPKEPRCPPLPSVLQGWVELDSLTDSSTEPSLFQRRLVKPEQGGEEPHEEDRADGGEQVAFEQLADHPEVQQAWEQYLDQKWRPWATEHQRWQNIQGSYSSLFAIHQSLQRLGEEYELVVGLGYLTWQVPSGRQVKRHVLTIKASIEFDADRGILAVRPATDGASLRVELDMLNPSEQPAPGLLREISEELESDGHDPWDRVFVDKVIRSITGSMAEGSGEYEAALSRHEGASITPHASLAPSLILRKRSALTMRGALEKIIADLKSAEDVRIPWGVRGLCDIEDDSRATDDTEHDSRPAATVDLEEDGVLFPLPSNREQAAIVDAIRGRQGVLVQGPPGTGKSHTIANLICHLLAQGKRILVTAQTPRALKVLQEKLPGEMASLCVSILGNDRASLENFSSSVMEISRRHSQWDKARNRVKTESLRNELRTQKARVAELGARLRDLREIETRIHDIAGGAYKGTAQKIAARVAEEASQFSWFTDGLAEDAELPFGEATFQALRAAWQRIDKNRETELTQERVSVASLPAPEDMLPLFQVEKSARRRMKEYEGTQHDETWQRLRSSTKDAVLALGDALRALGASAQSVEKRPLSWIKEAVQDILTDHDTPWKALQQATAQGLEGLGEKASEVDKTSVRAKEKVPRARLLADAKDLTQHLANGGKLGWWVFRPKVVKQTAYLAKIVEINGRPCDDATALAQLIRALETFQTIDRLWRMWEGKTEKKESPLSLQAADLEEHLEALDSVIGIESQLKRAKEACAAVKGLGECAWHDHQAVDTLGHTCETVLVEKEYHESKGLIDQVTDKLRRISLSAGSHPSCRAARDALDDRDLEAYGEALAILKALEKDVATLDHRNEWMVQLSGLAPDLARDLSDSPDSALWDERIPQIAVAWSWARANSWLRSFIGNSDESQLEREISSVSDRVAETTAKLCESKAWFHFFERLQEKHRRFLVAAVQSIRKIGRGKGRHAPRYRREAQQNLEQCRDAIPAWVMPLYRVYETMRPEAGMFDVIIVDEASQCGPDSLVLLYLADKVVIVGDDKQISPVAVGINRDDVVQLINQYLSDVPLKETFDVTSSLYDRAQIQYGHPIALREHFRCVPEIIRFSNDLCYRDGPLIPLRQYPPERLTPIIVRHVPNGYREGEGARVSNRPEAEALVEAVVDSCADPRYEGLTMGVISLQAEAQARLIESLLVEKLDAKEIEERRLICGDAYSFQGDERDVIFMSMVAAPNARIGPLTMAADERRFNVAASRAKDQVWLFHTAKLEDLSSKGLRYQLLNYYLHPETQQVTAEGISLDELRLLSAKVRRDDESPPGPFESWFEVDVFLAIASRGYRVVPQFHVANYRIDLVVEGLRNRLAVECDGDEFHGLDRFEEDQFRQRTLERCGWRFWRVRGCSFYANQEESLKSLWAQLELLGIDPV